MNPGWHSTGRRVKGTVGILIIETTEAFQASLPSRLDPRLADPGVSDRHTYLQQPHKQASDVPVRIIASITKTVEGSTSYHFLSAFLQEI